MSAITIEGNLTKDPELKYTPNGVAVCEISVAENRTFDQNGAQQKRVDFYDVKVWRQPGENAAASLVKGSRVVVIGRMERRQWEDAASGKTMYRYDVIATSIGASLKFHKAVLTKTAGQGVSESQSDVSDGGEEVF